MRPWIIERIEQERRRTEWEPVPLRIQQPPPEWIDEQRRREEEVRRDDEPARGVWIIEL